MTKRFVPPARRSDYIPAEDYRGPDQARLEAERLWPKVWQMACRESDLPEIGSFVRYDIFDDSILVVRAGEGADDIVAYYNVCQHRGRELVDETKGKLGATIGCRFHGWRWSFEGEFRSAYQAEDWKGCPDFDSKSLSLPRVKVGRWGGWVWINQDPDCEPLMDYLGVVPSLLDPFEPENMRPLWWKTILAPVNWKVVAEAFNEGYHSWATHTSGINYGRGTSPTVAHGKHAMFYSAPGGLSDYKDESGEWVAAKTAHENIWANNRHLFLTLGALTLAPGMAVSDRLRAMEDQVPPEQLVDKMFELYVEEYANRGVVFPKGLDYAAWSKAGTDWHIFPNSIVLPSLDGALWYRLRPGKTPDDCIFDIWSFGRFAPGAEPVVENEIYDGFATFSGSPFLEEDFGNMAAVNRGVKNRGFRAARTNPVQEVSVSNFHEVLASYLQDESAPVA
jgi:phenylpropionate dioxygenase-like ring-hydroxylating dioxygenase large terminal subunit